MFIIVASLLAAFDISKAKGPNGEDIEPIVQYSTNVMRYVYFLA